MTSIVTDERQRLIDELTSDMTRGDLIAVLEDLRFQGQQLRTLRLDRGVRDYLLAVLRGRRSNQGLNYTRRHEGQDYHSGRS
jgi:hypothetical protein